MGIEIRELVIKTEIQTEKGDRARSLIDQDQLRQIRKELLKATQQVIDQRLKRNSYNR